MEELQAINELLNKGMTVTEAEKHLGYSEGTLRRKLSKAGYRCDRKINQYVLKDEEVAGSNMIPKENKRQESKKQSVTHSNGVTTKQSNQKDMPFTLEQVDILQQMINEYIVRQQIQSNVDIDKGKTINRNVRVYENQFEVFASWCKTNNVTQADALYRAIELLINNKSH